MSERTGRIVVLLPLEYLPQLKLLREDMERRMGRSIKLDEIVSSAIRQLIDGIYEEEHPQDPQLS